MDIDRVTKPGYRRLCSPRHAACVALRSGRDHHYRGGGGGDGSATATCPVVDDH